MLIPLYLYRYLYEAKYNSLISLIETNFSYLDTILEFIFYSLLFFSVIVLIVCVFIFAIYKPVEWIYSKKFNRDQDAAVSFIGSYNKFFYGVQNRVSFIFRWILLVTGYIYLLKQEILIEIWNQVTTMYKSFNGFIQLLLYIPGVIYFLILVLSFYVICLSVAYRYLFFRAKESRNNEVES